MKRILILSAAFIFMGSVLMAQVEKSKPTKIVRKDITVKAVANKNEMKVENSGGSKLITKRLQVTTQPVIRKTKKR